MRLTPLLAALLAALLMAGCANPTGGTTTTAQKNAAKATTAKAVSLTGAVTAPAGVISTGGGNVISTGGGNVISTGGGNFRVLAVTETPLAGTPVQLVDAGGKPVADAKTDAQGKFTFPKVPRGTYMVVAKALTEADKKEAPLRSLVEVGSTNAVTQVGGSSTMVAALVMEKLGGKLDGFDSGTYGKLVTALAEHLTPDTMPDFSDPGDVLSTVTALTKTLDDLTKMVEEFEAIGVPAAQDGIDAAKDALDKAQQQLDEASVPFAL